MRFPLGTILVLVCATMNIASAQSSKSVESAVSVIKDFCLLHSQSEKIEVSGTADGQLSFRRLTADGQLKGEAKFGKSSVDGIILGVNNEISSISADQANKMRECAQPYLKRLVDFILSGN